MADDRGEMDGGEEVTTGYVYSGWCQTSVPHQSPKDNSAIWKLETETLTLLVEPGARVRKDGLTEYVGVPFRPQGSPNPHLFAIGSFENWIARCTARKELARLTIRKGIVTWKMRRSWTTSISWRARSTNCSSGSPGAPRLMPTVSASGAFKSCWTSAGICFANAGHDASLDSIPMRRAFVTKKRWKITPADAT